MKLYLMNQLRDSSMRPASIPDSKKRLLNIRKYGEIFPDTGFAHMVHFRRILDHLPEGIKREDLTLSAFPLFIYSSCGVDGEVGGLLPPCTTKPAIPQCFISKI